MSSGAKSDLVHSLGADHLIDYRTQTIASTRERYDVLIDLYGNPTLSQIRKALKPGGTVALVGGTGGRWFMGVDRWVRAFIAAPFLGFRARPLIHRDDDDDLLTIKRLIETGEVRPILDRTFTLDEVAKAIDYVTDGHARGQVVVTP
jgi:NADPH:quinone reductase-like Zn-dependent oxidoreductase